MICLSTIFFWPILVANIITGIAVLNGPDTIVAVAVAAAYAVPVDTILFTSDLTLPVIISNIDLPASFTMSSLIG